MKHIVKQQLKERKRKDIFNDYLKMYKKMMPINAIYKALEKKYYLDAGTIYRIVIDKKGLVSKTKEVPDLPD